MRVNYLISLITFLMKRKSTYIFYFLMLFFFFYGANVFAQDDWWVDKNYKYEKTRIKYHLCKNAFKDIAYGFSNQNINYINLYFSTQVYLNIISDEKGYYSANQAELILVDFMDYFGVFSVKYLRSHHKNSYAFAIGKCYYNRGSGKRELSISVALKYRNKKWIIDQINIY